MSILNVDGFVTKLVTKVQTQTLRYAADLLAANPTVHPPTFLNLLADDLENAETVQLDATNWAEYKLRPDYIDPIKQAKADEYSASERKRLGII